MATNRTRSASALVLVAACAVGLLIKTRIDTTSTQAQSGDPVIPVELVLLVDTSGSVDATEYELQQEGYVRAFKSAEVAELVEKVGGIVVTYIEWSDTDHQSVRVPWTRLDDAADCISFASSVDTIAREASGDTMMAPAIEFAVNELQTNGYNAFRRVIDISGDGRCENWEFNTLGETQGGNTDPAFYGTPWDSVIPAVVSQVNQINGICIGTDAELVDFYTNVLPQGDGSFMMQVDDFDQFAEGIKQKLIREIRVIPGMFD